MNINNLPTELPSNLQTPNNKSDSLINGTHSALLNFIKQGIINTEKNLPPGTKVQEVAISPNDHHANTIYVPLFFHGIFFHLFLDSQGNSSQ